jgi:hypothetical protein
VRLTSRRIGAAALVLTLAAGLASACGGTSNKKSASHSTFVPPATDPDVPLDSVASDASQVYPGSAPHRQIRFHPAVGSTFTTTLDLSQSFTVQANYYRFAPSNTAPVSLHLTSTVNAVDPDGTVHSSFTLSAVTTDTSGVPAGGVAAVKAAVAVLEGRTGKIDMRPTGSLLAAKVDSAGLPAVAQSVAEQIDNALHQLIVVFPTEPVGEGATWQVAFTAPSGGLTTTVVLDVALNHLTTDRIDLTVKYHQTAPLGPIPLSDAPAGAVAELVGLTVSGTGTQLADLTRVISPNTTLQASGDILIRLTQGVNAAQVDEKLSFKLNGTELTG